MNQNKENTKQSKQDNKVRKKKIAVGGCGQACLFTIVIVKLEMNWIDGRAGGRTDGRMNSKTKAKFLSGFEEALYDWSSRKPNKGDFYWNKKTFFKNRTKSTRSQQTTQSETICYKIKVIKQMEWWLINDESGKLFDCNLITQCEIPKNRHTNLFNIHD